MFRINFRGLLATMAVLLAAATVGATPAMARDAEADRLGLQLSSTVFSAIDFRGAMLKGASSELGSMDTLAEGRPEWPGLLREALVEEFDHDMPAIEAMIGRGFARYFTVEEMRAGVVILSDPGVQQIMRLGAAGKPLPSPQPKIARDVDRISKTPAGKRFLEKFGHIDVVLDTIDQELIAELLPGLFRRFGEKAEALEATRKP